MNVKITKEEFDKISQFLVDWYLVGSKLHKTDSANSDLDMVYVVSDETRLGNDKTYQYTENGNNQTDYLICTEQRFEKCRNDGSDIVLYEASPGPTNYKIIKAYLGLAKRDLKEYEKTKEPKKKYHALRCWRIARDLMGGIGPNLVSNALVAQDTFNEIPAEVLKEMIQVLRDYLIKGSRNGF